MYLSACASTQNSCPLGTLWSMEFIKICFRDKTGHRVCVKEGEKE